ncbi:alanine racemase [Rosenbergiella sp. S61]|uniref:Alanine racemase n=1 Tax=Rosenbergiella gaditana TaxID=2726987 RepID=A0ABS5SUQ2_9GAMM|nr:alanine racemase [Rosenbergiella gaditana]MBT0722985.1 alanine racemase [Rosenbergiella gaditana]
MSRPIRATVNTTALSHNLRTVKALAPASKVWSVVKANAYGHGLSRCYEALAFTDGFALLNYEEAILLREAGITQPILLLEGFFKPNDLPLIDAYQLTTAVHSEWQLQALANFPAKKPIAVYLKINNGMNRLGFSPDEVLTIWQRLKVLPSVGEVTLMSHFARADENSIFLREPLQRLAQATTAISAPRCYANSAATLWHPDTHHQWIRPGVVLYGASPSGRAVDIEPYNLRPVMGLHSEIIAIQQVTAGEGIGYGHRYTTTAPQRIGIIACGYADGYPRHAPSGTPVWVAGKLCKTVGTVSMDMLMVDLTNCPEANIGSDVELWGAQLPVDTIAEAAGTVGYELLTAVTQRVPFTTLT